MAKTLTATDRSALIRLASSMEAGDPKRLAILAGLNTSMGESIASYQKLSEDFARKFHVKLIDLRHTGKKVMANFSSPVGALDALTLASWLKKSGVKSMYVGGPDMSLHWLL